MVRVRPLQRGAPAAHSARRLARSGPSEAFERAAQKLIRKAMRHDDRIGRHIHVGGTHFKTHGRLVHCPTDAAACVALRRAGGPKPKEVLSKATDDLTKAERHKVSGQDEPVAGTRA